MHYEPLKISFDIPALNVGAFRTSESNTAAPASGYSGIFHFPFRIYAQEELHGFEGRGSDFRYRVHAPFLVRRTGSPVTDDVPQELWPNFRWHVRVPREMRGEQSVAPDLYYQTPARTNAIWYDGLRFDLWGTDALNRLAPFVLSAMRWLRKVSCQPWISDVDRHYGSTMKRSFPIDDSGAAVHEAPGLVRLRPAVCSCVTNTMWQSAFAGAAQSEVPTFYNLYFDAVNAAAIDDYSRATMNLAMALESCRDYYFSKIYPADFVEGRGPRLKAPFNLTDLLKHVSATAATVFGRDFSVEHSEDWPHLKNLYFARQHVAHGKGPVFPASAGLTLVDIKSFLKMQKAAWMAFTWMADVVTKIQEQPQQQ